MISTDSKRLVDENRHACLNKRASTFEMFLTFIGWNDHAIYVPNYIGWLIDAVLDTCCLGDGLSILGPVTPNMSDLRSS
jgi:hypothetical protein